MNKRSTASPAPSPSKARRIAALAIATAAMSGAVPAAALAAAAPLPSDRCQAALTGAEATAAHHFFTHVDYAHLETSPVGQAQEALEADDYVKIHTIWVESMVSPFADALSYC